MKIVFIEPKSPNFHIYSHFRLPRLGSVLLATKARNLGHSVKVFVEEISQIDWNSVREADLVAISTITSTAPRAYAIADRVRRMGISVLMGGPHPTYMPEEACKYCDFVLTGEADETFLQFLEFVEGKRAKEEVQGLVWLENRELHRNRNQEKLVDVELNPAPDLSLISGFHHSKIFTGSRIVVPVQVSRGCPHDCSFCSVTGIFGRKIRYRSVENVMEELRKYNDSKYHVFFYDDNFAASPRRAKELLSAMLEAKTKFTWSAQMRVDAGRDRQLLELMKVTRCTCIYAGIESPNPASLREAKKRQEPEEMKELLLLMRKYGISVHGMFVIGFDSDGPDCWKDIVNFAKSADIGTIQALILTPLPGTRTFSQMDSEKRILFRDWSLYDSHHVVFKHPSMTASQLQSCQTKAHMAFYSFSKFIKEIRRGNLSDAIVPFYARAMQFKWDKQNYIYLKAIKLMKPFKEINVNIDIKVPVTVE